MSTPSPGIPPDLPLSMLPPRPRRERWWLHVLLLVVTFGTMTWVGTMYVPALDPDAFRDPAGVTLTSVILASALWYALPLALILLSHEMGHYLYARWHGVDSTLPFFIPMPFGPVGTFGAVIRIRSGLPSRCATLDIGAAGPFAGFAVALPLLVWGIAHSPVMPVPGGSWPWTSRCTPQVRRLSP